MTYPDGIDALVNVNANDSLAAGGHAARHNSVNTALGEVKDFLGTGTGYRYNSTVYFTSNGTFTKATYPWLRAIRVKCQGAGGGGGGAATTGGTQVALGGAGSGGVYAESLITDIAGLSASVTVTVGAAGSAGAAGSNNGGSGGTTSFGSTIVSANGGNAGAGGVAFANYFQPGAGSPTTGTGDLVIPGGATSAAVAVGNVSAAAGRPGDSFLGAGGFANSTADGSGGSAGLGYGGGGSGGINTQNQGTARAGGAGAAGIVIVELFA
jgi:hypothetical protein